jgi:hypothetical protein
MCNALDCQWQRFGRRFVRGSEEATTCPCGLLSFPNLVPQFHLPRNLHGACTKLQKKENPQQTKNQELPPKAFVRYAFTRFIQSFMTSCLVLLKLRNKVLKDGLDILSCMTHAFKAQRCNFSLVCCF